MNTVNLNSGTRNFESKQQTITFKNPLQKWFEKQADSFEYARFGMMAIYMIVQSCIAAIAAMYILKNDAHILLLSVTAALAMASNSVFIAQGSAKLCLAVFYLSVVINVLFILFNI
ncbi:MAG: hypothetical protein V4677_13785 [Bacteroidota bacterium]